MTDESKVELGEFEGLPVLSTTITIRNTGHGLEEAVKTDPVVLHHAETVFVVLECEVEKVRHDPAGEKDDDGPPQGLVRVHMLKAGTATIVEPSIVQEHVRAQHERNVARRDREKGQGNLLEDPDYDPLTQQRRNPETGEWEPAEQTGEPVDSLTDDDEPL